MRKGKFILIFLGLFIFCFTSLKAQDFAGQWEGKLIASSNNGDVNLPFKMVINTDGKGNCGGQSSLWLQIDGIDYYVIYKFNGTYSGSSLKFDDFEIVNSKDPSTEGFYWCQKSGTLNIVGNSITGNITGYSPKGGCAPAKCDIKKVE